MGLHKVKQVVSTDKNCNTKSWKIKQELIWVHKWKAGTVCELMQQKKRTNAWNNTYWIEQHSKVLPTPSIKIRIVEIQKDVLLIPYDIALGVQSYSVFKYLQDSKRPENLSAEEFHIIPMRQKTLLHYK